LGIGEDELGGFLARINIEDEIYKDNRFYNLCFLLGSKRAALGALVEAWTIAQSKVDQDNPSGVFSIDEWDAQGLAPEIIAAKLATVKDGMVMMAGANKNFAWIIQRQEAGKRGGRPKKDETDRLADETESKATVTGSNPLTLTLTPSLSLSLSPTRAPAQESTTAPSPSGGDAKRNKPSKKNTPKGPSTQTTWESYRTAYMQRYGVEPIRNAAVNSKIKQFVARVGEVESPEVARFYVLHNSQRYITSAHSVGNLLFDAEKLRTEWARGRQITSADAGVLRPSSTS
jgi:hypothetical protein